MREEKAPEPGSATYHVNPHWDFPLRKTWVATSETPRIDLGSTFHAIGGPPHVNQFKIPAVIASAELPQLMPGAVIFDSMPLVSIPAFSAPPDALIARAEPPAPFPGSATYDVAPLTAIARTGPPPSLIVSTEPPRPHAGQAIAPRSPTATPLLSSRVFVVQAEAPRPEPGRLSTSGPPVEFFRATRPVIAAAEAQATPPGSAFADAGQPVAIPRFSAPPHVLVVSAEPGPQEPGRSLVGILPQWQLPPFIIYVDPRAATLAVVTNPNPWPDVDPRKCSLGPEYPT